MADGFIGQAFVQISPSFAGFQTAVRREMQRTMGGVGKQAGEELGKATSQAFSRSTAQQLKLPGFDAEAKRASNTITQSLGRAFAAAQSAGGRAASAIGAALGKLGAAASPITTAFGRAFSAVASAGGRAASAISSVFARLGASGNPIVNGLGRAFSAVTTAGGRAASAIGGAFARLGGAGNAVVTGLGRAFAAVTSAGGRAASAISSAFTRVGADAGPAISAQLSRAFEVVTQGAGRAASTISQGIGRVGVSSMKSLGITAGIAGGAMAGVGISTIKTGIGYNTLNQTARAAFKTILGSGEAAQKMMDDITKFARTSPFPRQAFIEATQRMLGFGIEAQKVIPYLGSIQDAIAATGGSAQTLDEITLVMSQIQAAGKITGVDLMQFAQRGINAAELIGLAMGKTATQIKEEISTGSFDATTALDALAKGMEMRFGGAAANLKTTWVGATDRIKGAMRDIGGAIVQPFIDPRGGGAAVDFVNKLTDLLRGIEPAVAPLATALGEKLAGAMSVVTGLFDRWTRAIKEMGVENFVERIKELAPVIAGIGGAAAVGITPMLSNLPVIGGMFKGLAGPVGLIGGEMKNLGSQALSVLPGFNGVAEGTKILGMTMSGPMALGIAAAVAGFATLMIVSPEFRDAIFGIVRVIWDGLQPAIDAIIRAFRDLGPPVMDVVKAIGSFLGGALEAMLPTLKEAADWLGQGLAIGIDLVSGALQIVLPMVETLLGWFENLLPVLGPITKAVLAGAAAWAVYKTTVGIVNIIKGIVTATKLLTSGQLAQAIATKIAAAAQWLWNAAMAANPIGLIVAAIALLIGGIILAYNKVGWFRAAIDWLWQAIQGVFYWIVDNWKLLAVILLAPIALPLAAALAIFFFFRDQVIGVWNAVYGAIKGAVDAIWGAILVAFNWIKNNWPLLAAIILAPFILPLAIALLAFTYFRNAIIAAWNAVGAAFNWVWVNVIKRVWDALSAAVNWVWNAVLLPTFRAYVAIWNWLGAAFNWVWVNIIQRAWYALRDAILWVWVNVILRTFNAYIAVWNALGAAFNWVWVNIIQRAWNALGAAVNWMWTVVIQPTWNRITSLWNALGTGINWVWVNVIQRAWGLMEDGLRALRSTFEWAVNAIGKVWDVLKKAVGTPIKIVIDKIINPLLDGINWLLDKVGIDKIPKIDSRSIPTFAQGGRVPGGWGGGDRVPALLEPGEWVLTKRQAAALGYGNLRSLPRYASGGLVDFTPSNIVGDIIDKGKSIAGGVWDFGKDVVNAATNMLRKVAADAFEKMANVTIRPLIDMIPGDAAWVQWMKKTAHWVIDLGIQLIRGKAEDDVPSFGMGIDEIVAQIIAQYPQLRVTSALRPGDTKSYHSKNLARDLAGPVPVMAEAGAWVQRTMAAALLEGIHNPTLSVKNGQIVPASLWGPATWAGHRDHLHLAAEAAAAGATVGGTLGEWVATAIRATGVNPAIWAAAISYQIQRESGGNPRAINNWDINAQNGVPSKGLMQVIDPTFAAYRHPQLSPNIWDPVSNIAAAIRYIMGRYGANPHSLGRWRPGGGYDAGGWLPTGASIAVNNTGRPEPVLTPRQWDDLSRAAQDGQNMASVVELLRRIAYATEQGTSVVIDGREVARVVDREIGWVS
jgi:tape measure domain-containing protein